MKFFIEYDSDTHQYTVYVKRWLLGRKKLVTTGFDSGYGILGIKDYVIVPYLLKGTTYDFTSRIKNVKDQTWYWAIGA